jgi:hypothetical protein
LGDVIPAAYRADQAFSYGDVARIGADPARDHPGPGRREAVLVGCSSEAIVFQGGCNELVCAVNVMAFAGVRG